MRHISTIFMALASLALLSCNIEEKDPSVTGIALSDHSLEMIKGQTHQLNAEIQPNELQNSAVLSWISSNESVASVDQEGLITALEIGETVINVMCGDISSSCKIKVSGIPVESVTLDKESIELKIGETTTLTAEVLPNNADNKTIEWISTENSVATVSDGIVTAIAAGEAKIIAKSGEIQAECTIKVTSPLKIGDYFYSDGTTSSELLQDKNVIGVVFWVGNPSKDDRAMQREHPECINGLVVSLNNGENCFWQENYFTAMNIQTTVTEWFVKTGNEDYDGIESETGTDDNINKMKGYNNTKVIELFNKDESNSKWIVTSGKLALEYNETVPAPSNTTGWYLPSAKELALLIIGDQEGNVYEQTGDDIRKVINPIIEQADGTPFSETEHIYWSSTENSFNSYCIYMVEKKLLETQKANLRQTRFILAF